MEHGWAAVCLSDGKNVIDTPVSYLHDSLLELAEMALIIKMGHTNSKVVFVQEPGELQFIVTITNKLAHYEVRQFKEWISGSARTSSNYEIVLHGNTAPARIVQQITQVLWKIQQKIGIEAYQVRWQHPFPMQQFKQLGLDSN
ncbi:MAG TPA: hypothetical protein ENJ56_01835 [Anaerolineae bacterium]|nr:hypothetical protein [Anaerolineae bacterium]